MTLTPPTLEMSCASGNPKTTKSPTPQKLHVLLRVCRAGAPSLGQPHWEGPRQWVKAAVGSKVLPVAPGGSGAVLVEQPSGGGYFWV